MIRKYQTVFLPLIHLFQKYIVLKQMNMVCEDGPIKNINKKNISIDKQKILI